MILEVGAAGGSGQLVWPLDSVFYTASSILAHFSKGDCSSSDEARSSVFSFRFKRLKSSLALWTPFARELSHWSVIGHVYFSVTHPCIGRVICLSHLVTFSSFALRRKVAEMGCCFFSLSAWNKNSFWNKVCLMRRRCGHSVHNQGRGEQRRLFCFVLDRDPSICRKPREQCLFQGRAVAEQPAQGSLKGHLRRTRPAGE